VRETPKLQGYLILALFKAAVAKENFGKSARTEEIVTNFYRYVNTYNSKAAEVVSANLGGPGRCLMKKLNAQGREDTILVSGNCNESGDENGSSY